MIRMWIICFVLIKIRQTSYQWLLFTKIHYVLWCSLWFWVQGCAVIIINAIQVRKYLVLSVYSCNDYGKRRLLGLYGETLFWRLVYWIWDIYEIFFFWAFWHLFLYLIRLKLFLAEIWLRLKHALHYFKVKLSKVKAKINFSMLWAFN